MGSLTKHGIMGRRAAVRMTDDGWCLGTHFCRLVLTLAHLLSEQVVNVTLCLREVSPVARGVKTLPSISTRCCVIVLNSITLL